MVLLYQITPVNRLLVQLIKFNTKQGSIVTVLIVKKYIYGMCENTVEMLIAVRHIICRLYYL